MNDFDLRASSFLIALSLVGCGNPDATDFNHADRGGMANGSGGAQAGTGGSIEQGGAGAIQQGGAGAHTGGVGGAQGGEGAGGGTPSGGSAGTGQSGADHGGASGLGGDASGGSAGTGVSSFFCGSLRCMPDRQWCRRTLPATPGGSTQSMCQSFPDSCAPRDCSCFCNSPQLSPCESGSSCTCSDVSGGITVVCGGA